MTMTIETVDTQTPGRTQLRTVGAIRQILTRKGLTIFVQAKFMDETHAIKATKAETIYMLRNSSSDEELEGYDVATYFHASNSLHL